MNKKYLIIVEGKKDEVKIFSNLLIKLGFKVESGKDIDFGKTNFKEVSETFTMNNLEVLILHSAQSRIHDIVIKFDNSKDDIERFFGFATNYFQGIFLIFDIDHNDNDDVKNMFEKFQDEYSGLLLVSSPCIEVLGDLDNKIIGKKKFYDLSKEYKGVLNLFFDKNYQCNVWEYISDNFFELLLKALEKNYNDFNEKNIMEHPRLVIEKINEKNIRNNYKSGGKMITECHFEYFTTVVYVFIAFIFGLTSEINNYSKVKDFFKNNIGLKQIDKI